MVDVFALVALANHQQCCFTTMERVGNPPSLQLFFFLSIKSSFPLHWKRCFILLLVAGYPYSEARALHVPAVGDLDLKRGLTQLCWTFQRRDTSPGPSWNEMHFTSHLPLIHPDTDT